MLAGTAAAWGTTPVRPYDPHGPVGMIQADGFQAPVASVLLDEQQEVVLLLCLVGPRAAVAALFAQLLQGKTVFFSSASTTEHGKDRLPPDTWVRAAGRYRQSAVPLAWTRCVVAVLLSHSLDLQNVCARTPTFPQQAPSPQTAAEQPSEPLAPVLGDAILLGNVEACRPALQTFLTFLKAVHVILPAGAILVQWAEVLWEAGVQEGLIQPLTAAGIRGWKVVGQAARWNDCILRHRAQLHWPQETIGPQNHYRGGADESLHPS